MKKYVGPPGTIDELQTAVTTKRKTHDTTCPECPFVTSQLHKQSTQKHHYVSEDHQP